MLRTGVAAGLALASLPLTGPAVTADETKTADAAIAAAIRIADCADCDYDFSSQRPAESARRGLVTVSVGAPEGGGYVIIMGYNGSRWVPVWEGNGSTRNVESLPDKIAICMSTGGWTNIRRGPGLNYPQVGRVTRPTVKKAFEVRVEKRLGTREGIMWYRISFDGGPAWVQNLRTIRHWGSVTANCRDWREYWSTRK